MTAFDESTPWEPPMAGDEVASLIGSLERQRRTLAWKCGGLDSEGLAWTVGVSSITLGGLLKHCALVETIWFSWRLWGRAPMPPFDEMDFDGAPNWDWESAAEDSPADLMALWSDAVTRSRLLLAEALDEGGLDFIARTPWDDGSAPSVRRILLDLIEEYARHVGHADLIRESVDGLVGEDPPRP